MDLPTSTDELHVLRRQCAAAHWGVREDRMAQERFIADLELALVEARAELNDLRLLEDDADLQYQTILTELANRTKINPS